MMQQNEIKNVIEAALLAYGKPINFDSIFRLFQDDEEIDKASIRDAITSIEQDCQDRGVELKQVGSGYRFQAKQAYAKWLQPLWQEKPPRYSRALLETMVLIAYKQPITRGEIEDVRGVSVSSHIIKTLQERDWVRVVGHRDVPGKPALFATTKEFLDYFNLSSLEQLPSLSQIKDLDKINEELNLSDDLANADVSPKIADAPSSDAVLPESVSTETDRVDPAEVSVDPAEISVDPAELEIIESFLASQDEAPSAGIDESLVGETTEDEIVEVAFIETAPTEQEKTDEEVTAQAAALNTEVKRVDEGSLNDSGDGIIENEIIDVNHNIDSEHDSHEVLDRPVNTTE
ncbi:MAG: SMC-Scp complex subunit ScpB [Thiohalomonadales bacterium]